MGSPAGQSIGLPAWAAVAAETLQRILYSIDYLPQERHMERTTVPKEFRAKHRSPLWAKISLVLGIVRFIQRA